MLCVRDLINTFINACVLSKMSIILQQNGIRGIKSSAIIEIVSMANAMETALIWMARNTKYTKNQFAFTLGFFSVSV